MAKGLKVKVIKFWGLVATFIEVTKEKTGSGGGGGGGIFGPLLKIRHTYTTMMKLGTCISYLRKIQKVYKSRDAFLEFC